MEVRYTERVASWADLVAHLEKHWATERLSPERARVSVSDFTVEVSQVEVFGAPWVEILGRLGTLRFLSPRFALGRNFQVPIGAIGLADGEFVLRQRLPLEQLRFADFDAALTSIAWQCRESSREISGVTP